MGGLYIHVPFCQSRCIYCDFYSTVSGQEWKDAYVEALSRELISRSHEVEGGSLSTIYLGGGTPSQLTPAQLHRIFDVVAGQFSLEDGAEVTIEANPDDVTPEWLEGLSGTPVNRVSLGVQTFSDPILHILHRRHSAQQAIDAVRRCQQAGYTNLSIDLIYGLPGQTMEDWQADVRQALALQVPHLSAYSLSFEEGTQLSQMLERGEVCEIDDDEALLMYQHLIRETEKAGMQHYEISNFALSGMQSRHNSSYWNSTPYLGVGPGAHSYDGKRVRRANDCDLKRYVAADIDIPYNIERLTDDDLYNELVMLRLRTSEGLPLSLLTSAQQQYCLRMAKPHIESGKLAISDGRLYLSATGIFVSNDIISDLMC